MSDRAFVADGGPLEPLLATHVNNQVDFMLTSAACQWPDRVAVVDGERQLTYRQLDEAVTALAGKLESTLDGGVTVAVASVLDADFVVAYYAILRSGNVVAPINPLLHEQAIAHALTMAPAALVFAQGEFARRVRRATAEMPTPPRIAAIGDGRIAEFEGGGKARAATPAPRPDDPACVLFTSGTTGMPKAISLSHRNITVNAGQVAQAHALAEHSVSAIHLPTYHPMHLNSMVAVGGTQVLCRPQEVLAAVRTANEHRATHYYSLPARLLQLVGDPRLTAVAMPTVRAIASGGSELPAPAAQRLTEHFGVPVFQGYGLAETSPLTHSDGPAGAVRGSVGRPVALTRCRVVDLDTRRPLPVGEVGEVQVMGPQVMLGYLDGQAHLDERGWFATGDLGRLGPDGRLWLVDRIKDVFKRDNWLVSPVVIERRLREHPAVVQCAVVDQPHPVRGAVATAFVVSANGGSRELDADISAYIRHTGPAYEAVERIEFVDEIPRSPNGKIVRAALRVEMADRIRRAEVTR